MIIGAMKCGTSSLYDYLSGHPQICPAITKEPEFFSENQGHDLGVEHYHDLFSFDRSVHKYTLDGSTGYTKHPAVPNVARSIHDYGIRPKFIYIIRNPFDRIESHFNFMQRSDSWTLDITDDHLINTCNYFLQLEQYREHFPLERILILDFQDLKAEPSSLLQRVYDFLDLPHSHFPDNYEVKNRTRHITSLEKKLRKLNMDRFLHLVPAKAKEAFVYLTNRTAPSEKRTLTETERKLVFSQLQGSMRDLNDVYGFDTSKWGF